jgi:hypothetical protein
MVSILFLAALASAFGAAYEGPAQGTVIAGPEVVSLDQAMSGSVKATSIPPPLPPPDQSLVQQMKLQAPRPPQRPDAIIHMPPPGVAAEVPVLSRFLGLGQTEFNIPDPAIAAGLSELVEVVNSTWAVYDKSGLKLAAGPLSGLFRAVNPPAFIYQPQVFFDKQEQRWVISVLARDPLHTPDRPEQSVWLLAVSQGMTPLGKWWVWKMDAGSKDISPVANLADDPALGYNDLFVALTANMYSSSNPTFQYAKVRILDKHELYQGRLRTYTDFWALHDEGGRLPSGLRPMRATEGTSDFFLASVAPDSGSLVTAWKVNGTALAPSLDRLPAFRIRHYDAPPDVPQRGTKIRLEAGPVRLQALQYMRGKLYCTFHEMYPWDAAPAAGVRYLVIEVSAAEASPPPRRTPVVLIDKTLGNGLINYFNPSVIVDARGDAYLTFNFSSPNLYPGVGYAGWPQNDTLSAPVVLKQGEAAYGTLDPAPFGHVTSVALDPNADNAAWVAGAYSRQTKTWGTEMAVLSVDPLRYQASVLRNGIPVQVKSDTLFKFGQTKPHWNAIGLRSDGTWHLDMWDANFLTLRARSSHDLLPVVQNVEFCVSDGNHSPLDTMGIKLERIGPNGVGTLQFSQAGNETALDVEQVNGPFGWTDNDVVKVYEYHATPVTDTCFTLSVASGNVDLGMAIFKSPNAPYYANRYEPVAFADNNGPGQGEYLSFKAMTDDYYAVVTWANNRATGRYSFSTACHTDIQPGIVGSAGAFSLKVGESGVTTTDASIDYDVAKKTELAIRIYDAQGRTVRTLVAQNAVPGHYHVTWDGRSATGRTLASGTYFVRFESKEFNTEQKIVKVQ